MVVGTRSNRRDLGQSLVEFALILPVLIVLLLGAVDFGRLLQARVTAESALRAGASWGATNLLTARQPFPPAGTGSCGAYSFSPSCNVLARACAEAAGFPNFSGGPTRTGSGGSTYQTCSSGSAANVCTPSGSQSNPFLSVAWSHAGAGPGVTFDPTSSMPVAGDVITVSGTFCFKTLTSYPVIPNQTALVTTSIYTVQQ